MKNILLILGILFILTQTQLLGQVTKVWDKRYGGGGSEDFINVKEKNDTIYLVGSSNSQVGGDKTDDSIAEDIWILKLKNNGDIITDKTIKGNKRDFPYFQMFDGEKMIILSNSVSNAGLDKTENCIDSINGDAWNLIVKDNTIIQDKTLGGTESDYFVVGKKLVDGYLFVGSSRSNIGFDKSENCRGGQDIWIVKTDFNFQKIWDKTYGGNRNDATTMYENLVVTDDGNFLISGISKSDISGDKTAQLMGVSDFWLLKITPNGDKLWDKSFGGSNYDHPDGLLKINNGYLLYGISNSDIGADKTENSRGGFDYWVIKIDENGNKLWDKTFGTSGDDELLCAITTQDGGYLLAGYSSMGFSGDRTEASWGQKDYWIVKIDQNGNKLWDRTFGTSGNDVMHNAIQLSDKSFLLCGTTDGGISGDKSQDSRGGRDFWLIKTTPDTLLPFAINTLNLKGNARFESISLQWDAIGNDKNCTQILERSQNAKDFTPLFRLQSDSPNGSYIDRSPLEGLNYYRVTYQCNGDKKMSDIIEVRFYPEYSFEIFPNPMQNTVNIRFAKHRSQANEIIVMPIRFFDVQGRELFPSLLPSPKDSPVYDVSTFPAGAYIIKIGDEIHRKLIIE